MNGASGPVIGPNGRRSSRRTVGEARGTCRFRRVVFTADSPFRRGRRAPFTGTGFCFRFCQPSGRIRPCRRIGLPESGTGPARSNVSEARTGFLPKKDLPVAFNRLDGNAAAFGPMGKIRVGEIHGGQRFQTVLPQGRPGDIRRLELILADNGQGSRSIGINIPIVPAVVPAAVQDTGIPVPAHGRPSIVIGIPPPIDPGRAPEGGRNPVPSVTYGPMPPAVMECRPAPGFVGKPGPS